MGADPGGTVEDMSPPVSEKHELCPPNKNTLNYSKLNKCIFRLHILHILDSHLKRNYWNGGTNKGWQIYFWLQKTYTDTGSLLPGSPGKWQMKTNKEWFYIHLCKYIRFCWVNLCCVYCALRTVFCLELFTSITGIVKPRSVSLHNLVRASYFDIHPYQLIMHKVVSYTGRKGRWWEELGIWEGWREAKEKNMTLHARDPQNYVLLIC